MLAPCCSTVITEKHLLYAPATSTQPGMFNPCLQSPCNLPLKVTVQKSHQASRKPQKTVYSTLHNSHVAMHALNIQGDNNMLPMHVPPLTFAPYLFLQLELMRGGRLQKAHWYRKNICAE